HHLARPDLETVDVVTDEVITFDHDGRYISIIHERLHRFGNGPAHPGVGRRDGTFGRSFYPVSLIPTPDQREARHQDQHSTGNRSSLHVPLSLKIVNIRYLE